MSALRPLLRDLAAEALALARLTDPARRLHDRLTIATFHRVLPERQRQVYPLPGLVVTPEELDWFLSYFRAHFTCGSLAEVTSWWPPPAKSKPALAITFDDGQLDNYEHARAVLAEHHVHASFYIPVCAVEQREALWHDRIGFPARALLASAGRAELLRVLEVRHEEGDEHDLVGALIRSAKRLTAEERAAWVARLQTASGDCIPEWAQLMSWDQIRSLAAEGHEIGSHSMTHALLPQCSDAELEYELGESRRVLQQRVGAEIGSLCYPNGDYDARALAVTARAGYRFAVTTRWGTNGGLRAPFELLRCDMNSFHVRTALGGMSRAQLSLRISGLHPGLR